ncbi:hypothetical protein [Bacillus cihuensis]|uniref:hypothetical protein n=1 Tax=Bacillus cihuensis TaxID=1208599 RepID=UPI0003F65ED9|nr:hypothetical protein [Bacillus cihuensis]
MYKTTIGLGNDFLYGYVNGERFMVANTVEQICAFILKERFKDVIITDFLDQMEIETSMGFILYCNNQEFLVNELLPVLVPMQKGEKDIPEFVAYVDNSLNC